jgi:hypothetical protein
MRHRFVPDLGGLEHRFLLVKAFPSGSGSTSPPVLPADPPPPPPAPADPSAGDPGAPTDPSTPGS